MINQQLVDYIKQQLQAGVAKEAVRKALGDAGWPPADADDSIKAAAAAVEPAMAAQPVVAQSVASQPTINPAVAMDAADRSVITSSAIKSSTTSASSSDKFFAKPMNSLQMSHDDEDEQPPVKKFIISMAVMGAVILLLAGALAFVYFTMSGQLDAARQSTGADPAQVQNLQSQVSQLSKDKDDLNTQLQSLNTERQSLLSELGFFAAPAGTSTAPVSITVMGLLSGNASTTFVLTTAHNVKITIANSKDAKVTAALTPLLTSTTTVTLAGSHAPASSSLTVTVVNGTTL